MGDAVPGIQVLVTLPAGHRCPKDIVNKDKTSPWAPANRTVFFLFLCLVCCCLIDGIKWNKDSKGSGLVHYFSVSTNHSCLTRSSSEASCETELKFLSQFIIDRSKITLKCNIVSSGVKWPVISDLGHHMSSFLSLLSSYSLYTCICC